jgi:hypothetical protein
MSASNEFRDGTPTGRVPLLSQNDAKLNPSVRSPKTSLISLILWLAGDKSLTNLFFENVTLSSPFKTFARSAPRWGVPRNAMAMVFVMIFSNREMFRAIIIA